MGKVVTYLLSPYSDVDNKRSSVGKSVVVLDGIRGLAVLIVLASHTNSFGMYAQGSLGVLLFFFLSGYVLSVAFVAEPKNMIRIRSIRRFGINRILRILPIYLVLAAATALVLKTDFHWYLWNVSFIKGWNHFWSVAEEARFYVLFPFVMALLAILQYKHLRIVALVGFIFFAYKYRGIHQIDMMDGRHVSFYFYMFLGGCLTCFLVDLASFHKWLENAYVKAIFSLATVFIFLFIFFSSSYMIDCFWRPIFPNLPKEFSMNGWSIPGFWLILFVVLFFSLTFYREGFVYNLLTRYFFRHFGLLSYSIYLSHMVLLMQWQRLGFVKEGLFFVVLLSSYVVALLSYVMVEKPFLLLKNKWK